MLMVDLELLPGFFRKHGLLLRHAQNDPVPFALTEGRAPTARESRAISQNGYGLHLLTSVGEEEGAQVAAMLPNLEHLTLTGVDLELQWVERLTALSSLSINGTVAIPADLSHLEELTEYAGTLRGAETVFNAPQITQISVDDVRDGVLPAIPPQLTRLSLTDLHGVRSLSLRPGDTQLEHLSLIGSRHFDADALRPLRRLRSIELTQVAAMTHLEALRSLPDLETLSLGNCDLEHIEALYDLTNTQIHVWGGRTFVAKMKDLAGDRPHWYFH
jgi:hypothetical protein